MSDENQPLSATAGDQFNLRLDPRLAFAARFGARQRRQSLRAFIEDLIEKELAKPEYDQKARIPGYSGPRLTYDFFWNRYPEAAARGFATVCPPYGVALTPREAQRRDTVLKCRDLFYKKIVDTDGPLPEPDASVVAALWAKYIDLAGVILLKEGVREACDFLASAVVDKAKSRAKPKKKGGKTSGKAKA